MGKVTKFTGSKLLGAELRRLRGGRSLKQIAEISKTPPLSERVGPVAAPTLSQIENGISFPSLETIHSLAHIYQRPVQQLLDLVVQDRLGGQGEVPEDAAEATVAFADAFREGRWHESLNIASQLEGRSGPGPEALKWRTNRALSLQRLGMRHDALDLLRDCLNDSDLPRQAVHRYHQRLANGLSKAGQYRSASIHSAAALAAAPEDLEPNQRRALLTGRAFVLLASNADSVEVDEREVREALHLLTQARATCEPGEEQLLHLMDCHASLAQALLGNAPVAARNLARLLGGAETARPVRLEALLVLGWLRRRQGRESAALKALDEAIGLAVDLDDFSSAFEAAFEAFRVIADSADGRASLYLRKCQRFHPFVGGRSPNVRRFERLAWSEA